ncbi:hypothetical protein Tco_0698832 [Tanacetum coccineum]
MLVYPIEDKDLEEEVTRENLNAPKDDARYDDRDINNGSSRGEELINSIANEMCHGGQKDNPRTLSEEGQFAKTSDMDDAFIQAMLTQQEKGNRPKGTFSSTTYASMLSGFSWNFMTQLTEAEEEVWEKPAKVNPDAIKWRTKPISNYDELSQLFAKDRASGLLATNKVTYENLVNLEEIYVDSPLPFSPEDASNATKSKSKKRKLKEESNSDIMSTVHVVVDAIKEVACRDLEAAFEHSGGSPAGIHGLFSGWYCGLAGRKVTLRVSMAWAKGVTTGTLVRYETSCSRLPVICVIDWICMLACNHVEDVDVRKSG